jgi:hypothetical protein
MMPEDKISPYDAMYKNLKPVSDFFSTPSGTPEDWEGQQSSQQPARTAKPLYQPSEETGFRYPNVADTPESAAEYAQVAAAPPEPAKPAEVVSSLFGDPPAPKYDKERQDRIQRNMKLQGLGEGMRVLGDLFSLGTGANVIRRQPNQDVKDLYGAWQSYEDQYANRMDEHNRQAFNMKLAALYRAEDKATRAADKAQAQKNWDAQMKYKEEADATKNAIAALKMQMDEDKFNITAKETERYHKATVGAAYERNDIARNKAEKPTASEINKENYLPLEDEYGRPFNLTERDVRKIFPEALKYYSDKQNGWDANDYYDKAAYPNDAMTQIVGRYYYDTLKDQKKENLTPDFIKGLTGRPIPQYPYPYGAGQKIDAPPVAPSQQAPAKPTAKENSDKAFDEYYKKYGINK